MSRKCFLACLLVAAVSPAWAESPSIRLPVTTPAQPIPGPAGSLVRGERYVVPATVKCDIMFFPDGLVAVEEKVGPRDWTAIFAGGTGDYEDRTYTDPFLYSLKAVGTGRVKVVFVPQGYKDRSEWVEAVLDVDAGLGSQPPPTRPPTDPPDTRPPTTPVAMHFVVVRPDGPASAAFTRTMSDPAWDHLRAKGHRVNPKTVSEAATLGVALPAGTSVPCVVTLRPRADGKTSEVVRSAVPLPADGAGILKLAEGL